MLKEYDIKLTSDELKFIDGKVSEKAQKIINTAKQESSYGFDLPVMNEILKKSEEQGKLTWRYKDIRSCSYCDKKYDYYTYPRSGKYHKKGDKNTNKPKYYRGIAFNEEFVTFVGYGDICAECATKHNVINRLIDYILDNDLKIQIQKNEYKISKYLKDEIQICYKCGEEMQESKMSRRSTMMGDGTYPAGCPHCKTESLPFGQSHKTTNKFKMIKNPMFKYQDEINSLKEIANKYNQENEKDKIKFGEIWNKPNQFYVMIEKTNNPTIMYIYPLSRKYRTDWQHRDFPEQVKLVEDKLVEFGYKQ